MKKLYLFALLPLFFVASRVNGQECDSLKATFQAYSSRCTATGSIKIFPSGGSGNYKYKVTGPVNTNYTTSDSLTGLAAGVYMVTVTDIKNNCILETPGVTVGGNYGDPGFILNTLPVGCDNGDNGGIMVEGLTQGREPFTFSIVAPSASGVGTTNSIGVFTGLIAGNYTIRLMDSCGGIQTRTVTVDNYNWHIDSYSFTKFSCDSASGYLKVVDSRGNISTVTGIPGMKYAVKTSAGDIIWSTDSYFRFKANGITSIEAIAMDSCGNMKKIQTSVFLIPSVNNNVGISNKICSTFTAQVKSVKNFSDPQFCLFDENDVLLDCNTTGKFTGLAYGSYCIKSKDGCTDTVITRCFSEKPPVASVATNVSISDKNCTDFDVSIGSQNNLNNPQFCLVRDGTDTLDCNVNGTFLNIPYGEYCILIKDGCLDTTITRCFTVTQPKPYVVPVITPSYVNCDNFGLNVTGNNLYTPTFCLFDNLGNKIDCNGTGIFDSIPLGSYCVTIHDDCTDTTIQRCLTVGPPTASNDLGVKLSDQTCSSYTATIQTSKMSGSAFCLFLGPNLVECDSSAKFSNLSYGKTYCVIAKSACPDTTFTKCFSATAPVPSVGAEVSVSNQSCSTFTAQVTNQKNLTNPEFCIVNAANDTLTCNATGKFTDLAYGAYTIVVKNTCFDTTFTREVSASPIPFSFTVSAARSCTYGLSRFWLDFSGNFPVNARIFNPAGTLIYEKNTNADMWAEDIPNLPNSEFYTIVAIDKCGNTDTATVAPIVSYMEHQGVVRQKCPGSIWLYGSGDIDAIATTNTGNLTVRIIKRDAMTMIPALTPNIVKDSVFTFQDLGPATYIVQYNSNDGCNQFFYDTITINPYKYPTLDRSTAYFCDVNGFSVGAVASFGVPPFTYQIFNSTPNFPPIVTAPQASPIFTINNGMDYSLIAIRALDACGNATTNSSSILPLVSNAHASDLDCWGKSPTLSVDTVYNSTYTWYKKDSLNATDSIEVGSGLRYTITEINPADTGIYVCHLSVNSGCIERNFVFWIDGLCETYIILPVMDVKLSGEVAGKGNQLQWQISSDQQLSTMVVERMLEDKYVGIGNVNVQDYKVRGRYTFLDPVPGMQNYYRIKIQLRGGKVVYSNVVFLGKKMLNSVYVFPNPATDHIKVRFQKNDNHLYKITIFNTVHQQMASLMYRNNSGNDLEIHRSSVYSDGMYIVKILDTQTGNSYTQKIIFSSK